MGSGSSGAPAERAVWVVRYSDKDGLTVWLSSKGGTRGEVRFVGEPGGAYEHTNRHDAYTARDEWRKALDDASDWVEHDINDVRVCRRYRPLDGGST